MSLPDCPSCDADQSLQVIRSDTNGLKWCLCSVCAKTVLLDAKNRIVHKGT
jgi:transposase-like protein